jgi:hypothetical protein
MRVRREPSGRADAATTAPSDPVATSIELDPGGTL